MSWIVDNLPIIGRLAIMHLLLVIPPLAVSTPIAVVVGRAACRHSALRSTVARAMQLLYAIPALPLLVIVPAVLGTRMTSPVNVMVALGVYALALLVRSGIDAFSAVNPDTVGVARALGFSRTGMFFRVELPLALPVFLAGLRVAVTSTVALTSIGALVGVASLGSLLTDGFQRGIIAEVIAGIVAIVVLALCCDGVLLLASRIIMPWRRRGGTGHAV